MVTDVVPSSLMACIIFSVWLNQISRMVLCFVHVMTVGIRGITLAHEPYTPTCCEKASCQIFFLLDQARRNMGYNGK